VRGRGGGASLPSRLGRYAPIQFVGPAAILVALIVFTPILLTNGPSALAVQAELTIYRVTGGTTTEFYVHAVGSEVPYAQIDLDYGTNFTWVPGACPTSGIHWTHTNATDLLELGHSTASNPFLVNATAVYAPHGARTVFAGMLAFDITGVGQPDETVTMVPCTSTTPGLSAPTSWSVSKLPLSLLLVNYGSGGPP
jgi:hypothetical protein